MRVNKLVILLVPWLLSSFLALWPTLSYLIAWAGSFLIFYLTLSGRILELPKDLKVSQQLMRPIFLTHIIFAGYMSCTSIFYFIGVLGYVNFESPPPFFAVDQQELESVAKCQRLYCLAHASFVCGILLVMNYPRPKKNILAIKDEATFFLVFALITLPLSTAFLVIPGLRQFYFQFNSLSFIAGTLALAYAIPLKKIGNTVLCSFLYISNFTQSLLSGYKEPIIISVIVLGVFLYPFYKKTIFLTFIPILIALFIILPAYNQVFRSKAWGGEESAQEASDAAIDAVLNSESEDSAVWGFLTGRLSEIHMFIKYVDTTPFPIDYYGFDLIEQSLVVIIPRAFWPAKPITEEMVMERVYNAGVVSRGSHVSAKPPLVVDGYLSGGTLGVFITLLVYGLIAQLISMKAEDLFGGYTLGTALIYSGLFQILWRGLSFEFIINSVFWSYFSMLIIFWILKMLNIIKSV
ncbi:exosortase Y-associated Wzy-like protein [Paradesertivirga mongoliensis]|uniref:Exosortase Y-associated Wzy-like protein n=1 Tax=Paradesertivirga mongoliensis TaxID=2100740 RepID=A0ABW4ZHG1_9SPHI|nr:hypothetical protein [Pedobacter mongoliensis]